MRAIIQRALKGSVSVDGQVVGEITQPGLVVLVGVARGDGATQAQTVARKIAELRLFEDETSVIERGAPVLLISQFTLYGDTKKGRRPSWIHAAPGPEAQPVFMMVVEELRARGIEVATGVFGAYMQVSLVNDGPFTVMVEA